MSMRNRVDRKLGSVYTLNPLVGNGWVVSVIRIASVCGVGKPGGHNRKFNTYAEAEVYLLEKIKERDSRLKFNKPKRGKRNPYQKKPTAMQLLGITPDSLEVKSAKATKLVLTCYFGGKNDDSTITGSDGKSEIVALSSGATAKLKYLELAHAAIQYADNAINGGVDCVEVWGIDCSVLVTLNDTKNEVGLTRSVSLSPIVKLSNLCWLCMKS